MVVYNKTVIDKEEVLSSLVKITRMGQLSRFILSTIILLCGLPLAIYGHISSDSNYTMVGYVFLAFAVVYYGMSIFTVVQAPKKVYKQNKDICDYGMTYNYVFKEQSFQVQLSSMGKNKKLPYKYSDVKRIYEYEDKYEFRLVENQVLFVYKIGFENERYEDFFRKNLLKNKKKIRNKMHVS